MSSDPSPQFVHATFPDGSEAFGVDAFPFRRDGVDAVAFDAQDERRVVTAAEATFRLFDPAVDGRIPSASVWLAANSDAVLRRALKQRCGL